MRLSVRLTLAGATLSSSSLLALPARGLQMRVAI